MIYDNILGTIGHTPIVKIQRLAPEEHHDVCEVRVLQPAQLGEGPACDRHHRRMPERTGALKPGQTVVEPPPAIPGLRWPWFVRPRAIRSWR